MAKKKVGKKKAGSRRKGSEDARSVVERVAKELGVIVLDEAELLEHQDWSTPNVTGTRTRPIIDSVSGIADGMRHEHLCGQCATVRECDVMLCRDNGYALVCHSCHLKGAEPRPR